MSNWITEFMDRYRDDFECCRCGHFRFKHVNQECFGVEWDDHSVRCECRKLEVLPPVSCSNCGQSFRIHDRTTGFSHCDQHTEWEAEDE